MQDTDIVTVHRHALLDHSGLEGVSIGGLEKINFTNVPLLTGLAPSTSYTWTSVDITAMRALIWRMTITADVNLWSFLIYSQASGAGEEMFAAAGFPNPSTSISWPWVYENGDTPSSTNLYIGIRNDDTIASNFTLTRLTGEKLA